jgi:hypothetical protein
VPEPLQGRWSVCVDLTFLGEAIEAEVHLEPLRNIAGPTPTLDTLGPVPLAAVGDIAAEPNDPLPLLHDSTLLTRLDAQGVAALTDAIDLGHPSGLAVTEIRQLGGALARHSETHGAIGHVDEPYLLIYGGVVAAPELAGPIAGLVNRVRAAVRPFSAGRTVPNFAAEAEHAYPPDVLARLGAIKRERDLRGVIRSNRPVGLP